ncbi:DUF6160 family protein [Marinobacter sp. C2H3]|uniref:DUF6160 family protein n=1 Tax=Marinobacter sp. C2H3 TaxID=3119003 RepID=UPI00300EE936
MTKRLSLITLLAAVTSSAAVADLKRLDDETLSAIQGQSGITLEMDLGLRADGLSYVDDGNAVELRDVRVGSASDPGGTAHHRIDIDVRDDASLNLDYLIEDRRIEFGDVRLAGAPGVGMGGVFFDHTLDGHLTLRPGGATGHGYTFDTAYTMTGGRLGYRTNGNEIFLDDMTLTTEALGVTLDVVDGALALNVPRMTGQLAVGAIRFSGNPLNHGRSTDVTTGLPLASYGGIRLDYDLSSHTRLAAGGRDGEGMTLNHETTIHSANFLYLDDGHALALRDITGDYRINNLTIDVARDWQDRPALALAVDSLEGTFSVGAVDVGDSGRSFGRIDLSFLFADQSHNGQSYTNALYLQGGGHPDAGPQGLRLAAEWSLSLSDLSYTEDGNRVIFSGLQSWGRGDVTVNVTRHEVRNGTQFYDGLRIGFDGVKAGYRINGLRVGSEDAPLQGGTELLLALGIYPAYEFELDGQLTLAPGGASGEGLTINSDIQLHNGKAAVIAAPYDEGAGEMPQKGLWLTEVEYDGHVRDMTLDVTDEGVVLGGGESWSTMDIGNVRVGDKSSGQSFGRLVVSRFEKGSTLTLIPGGAGNVCAGGVGSTAGDCAATGGVWEMRGEEGMTIRLKQLLAPADGSGRRNALAWETNRTRDAQGRPVNGTGMAVVLDNIYTSDGVDANGDGVDDNRYGIRTDLALDVYQTRVIKKQDGPDALGVVGARGDEKIQDPSSAAGYRYVSNPTPEDRLNRPLGFAVRAESSFRELNVGRVDLVHPVGGAQTAVYGIKLQNMNLKANLTATPIP